MSALFNAVCVILIRTSLSFGFGISTSPTESVDAGPGADCTIAFIVLVEDSIDDIYILD